MIGGNEVILLALRIVASDAVADLLASYGYSDAISDEAADVYYKLRPASDSESEPFLLTRLFAKPVEKVARGPERRKINDDSKNLLRRCDSTGRRAEDVMVYHNLPVAR